MIVLALCAAAIVSLLTWSANDPSWAHYSSTKPRNWLGPIGAVFSDLVMNTLGLAGVFALLPPVYWATDLLTKNSVLRLRTKLIVAPLAVLCLAAFLSALPRAGAWIVPAGYGGLLGDFGFNILMSTFAAVNAERAAMAAGFCFMASGFALLMLSIGVSPMDVKTMARRPVRGREPDSSWVSQLKNAVIMPHAPMGVATDVAAFAHPFSHAPDCVQSLPGAGDVRQHTNTRSDQSEPAYAQPVVGAPPASMVWSDHAAGSSGYKARVERHHLGQIPIARIPSAPLPDAVAHAQQTQASAAAWPMPRTVSAPTVAPPVYRMPLASLLPRSTKPQCSQSEMHVAAKIQSERLKAVLSAFSIAGEMRGHICGPVVSTFDFEPASGTRSARVMGLADDIARGLGVRAVRVQVAPGRASVTIEVPHADPIRIGMYDLIDHDSYRTPDLGLPLVLGVTAAGEPCVADLRDLSNLLLAGHDPVERANMLCSLLASLLYRLTPETGQLLLAGCATEDFAAFGSLPHLAMPAGLTAEQNLEQLVWAAAEIDNRTLRMRALAQTQAIEDYNARLRDAKRRSGMQTMPGDLAVMPYLIIVIADLAELAAADLGRVEHALHKIARFGRASGVHVIAATSRLDVVALPPSLKAVFTTCLALSLANKADSRDALGETGAEDLLGAGDMLAVTTSEILRRALGGGLVPRLHAALLPVSDASRLAAAILRPTQELTKPDPSPAAVPVRPEPTGTWTQHGAKAVPTGAVGINDALYDRAVSLVRREQSALPNLLRRHLHVSYGEALDLLAQMTRDRIISPADEEGYHTVLIGRAA